MADELSNYNKAAEFLGFIESATGSMGVTNEVYDTWSRTAQAYAILALVDEIKDYMERIKP